MIKNLRLPLRGSMRHRPTDIPKIAGEIGLDGTLKTPAVKNICLLGPAFGTNNLGLNALTTGTISAAITTFPQAHFWLLDYDDSPKEYKVSLAERQMTIPMVNMRFSKRVLLRNHIAMLLLLALISRAIPTSRIRRRFLASNCYLRQLWQSDLVVALAGGDSFSDIYGLERLWYVSLPQMLAVLLRRPLVLLPQTIGPFKTAIGRSVARRILRSAQRIYTRDKESLAEVTRLLGNTPPNASLAYDMAFALDPLPPPGETKDQILSLRQKGELVGLNVSGLLYAGGYTGRNQFGLRSDYRETIQRLLRFFTERQRVQVLLVPHVLGGAQDLESDTIACARIAEDMKASCLGRLHMLRETLDHHQVKWVIGQCDFFLGSRMHACIAAMSQAVPAMGLAYSRKFAGVFDTMGAGNLVADLTQSDVEGLLQLVEKRFNERVELRKKLQSSALKLRGSVLGLFKDIGQNIIDGTDQSCVR